MISTEKTLTQQKPTEDKKTRNPKQKAKLFARWTTVDGKLICKWFTSSHQGIS